MGIREIIQLIEEAGLDELRPNLKYESGTYSLNGLPALRKAILTVENVPGATNLVNEIKGTDVFGNTYERLSFSASNSPIAPLLNQLFAYIEKFYIGLKATIVDQDPHSVSIRLPDGDNLSQVNADLRLIENSLSQVILSPEIGGSVRVQTWLPGSLWIEIVLGTKAAVAAVGSIVWAALYLQRKKLENERFREHTRTLEIGNEYLDKLAQAQSKMIDNVLISEARAIEADFFAGEENPERLQRIKYSIQAWGELFERGAEVRAALNAPADEKAHFPTPDGTKMIESRIKHLTNSEPQIES